MTRDARGRPRWRLAAPFLLAAAFGGAAVAAAACLTGGSSTLPPPAVDFLRSYRAPFRTPARLAVDSAGRIYVADPAGGTVVIRGADGRLLTVGEGLGRPVSVAVDADGGRIFVGDGIDGRVSAYDPDWTHQLDLGQGDGELAFPGDLALDPANGNVWVTDSSAHRVAVYDPAGGALFSIGQRGDGDGQFQFPAGIFIDAVADEVLVADQHGGRVQIFDRAGNFKSCLGDKGGGNGRLNVPQGIWADELGRIYVADAFEGWVHVIDRQGATVGVIGGVGDVGAGPGRLTTPTDLVIDPSGRLVISAGTTARLEMFGLDGYADPERFVPAVVTLAPNPLDAAAPGAEVTAAIEVPGYRLERVDPGTVAANGVAADPGSVAIGDVDGDHEADLTAAFDGAALAATLASDGGTVRVAGRLGDLELEGFALLAVIGGPGGDSDDDSDSGSDDDSDGDSDDDSDGDSGDDSDGDSGDDSDSDCSDAPDVNPLKAERCRLDEVCPCDGPKVREEWQSPAAYLACVTARAQEISDPALRRRLLREAAESRCGKK